MIDSHCHLTDPRLHEQMDAVLKRAQAAGVTRFVTIGTEPPDNRRAIELASSNPLIHCAVGIHPNHSQPYTQSDVEGLRAHVSNPRVVALGEMGLDYFHKFADRDHQRHIFEAQLDLARETQFPVVIHSREAIDDTLAILTDFPTISAVFHCFTGTVDEARRIIAAGYLLGFTGPVTYKKNDALREVVKETPLDRMLIETDCPYLSPEPHRSQKINEPALVHYVCETIARVKGLLTHEIDAITTQNTLRFYRMK